MSILIKGMKMPEEGHVFVVFEDRSKRYVLYNDMRYPIIELPEQVKHGKWIDRVKDYWCSECGGRIQKEQAKMFSICPYCGANYANDVLRLRRELHKLWNLLMSN